MNEKRVALGIGAHPDDVEFLCAGSLSLLRQKGWEIHIASMAPGDCGSTTMGRAEISRVRRAEAARSAELLDGQYHCLECDDVFILYDRPTILKTIELFRKVRPTVVFGLSPSDYMVDHEHASKLVRTACFTAGIPNIDTPGLDPFTSVPYLYYMDPVGGVDMFGQPIAGNIVVDISSAAKVKEEMLCCHASQREWLRAHHGMDEYVMTMKRYDEKGGKRIGVEYAEGFRQHLGHAFPEDNLLQKELGEMVHMV